MGMIARFFAWIFGTATLLGLVGAAFIGYMVFSYSKDLPDHASLANYEPPVTTRVHAADGTLLAEYARERRLYLPINAMPKLLIAAYLSAEDKNFYKHGGVDPEGIARAVVSNFRKGAGKGRQQGASTITQQVAKNFFLSPEQSYERKIREALTAFRLEATFSKDKILELYLNQIYLGFGNYGVAAAALNYFGKSVHELTIAEAAYLAALPKAPSTYHPITNRDAAIGRRNYVIDRMVENGYITAEDARAARTDALNVVFRSLSPNTYAAGFFAEEVRREIAERYGSKKLYEGGLSVRSTLDPKMQILARKALSDGLVRFDEARGWRGATEKIPPSGDWGIPLAEVTTLTDIDPWRPAVVLSVSDSEARIGLQPTKLGGQIDKKRETGVIAPEGARWAGKRLSAVLSAGDVIYVEPIEAKPGTYRLRQVPEISGAIVAMDPYTGRVKAMVGGFSFDKSEFNRATQALRQPGSSFKPIVYAAALDNGYTPSSIIMDEPIELAQANGEVWRPENSDGSVTGPRTLRQGIEKSKNLMTIRLARDLGMPLVAEYAKRFGVYDDMLPVLAMSLGAGETTVMRMTAAYSMLANGGRRIRPTMIDRIQDRWGKSIYKHDERVCRTCLAEGWQEQDEPRLLDKRERVIDPMSAYQMVSIMEGVVQRGTATVIKSLGRSIAGKTGTTNEAKDVWFVGFSPDLAVGVYLGFDKPRSLGTHATAGQYAAPIFRDFMKEALAGKPNLSFRVPPGIKFIRVNAATGQRTSGGDGQAILEPFKPNTAPPEAYVAPATTSITTDGGGGGGGGVGTSSGGLY